MAAVEMEAAKGLDLQAQVSVAGIQRRLDEDQELALFRTAQEALVNARRHSHARQVRLRLDYQATGILLHIDDDGCGFQIPKHLGDLTSQRHYGLVGIQERMHALGGTFRVMSRNGSGTELEVFLPSQVSQQPDHVVLDPVCYAHIQPLQAYASLDYQNQTYYFCCPVCQGAFKRNPELYLPAPL